jgi:hypothetical protein
MFVHLMVPTNMPARLTLHCELFPVPLGVGNVDFVDQKNGRFGLRNAAQ